MEPRWQTRPSEHSNPSSPFFINLLVIEPYVYVPSQIAASSLIKHRDLLGWNALFRESFSSDPLDIFVADSNSRPFLYSLSSCRFPFIYDPLAHSFNFKVFTRPGYGNVGYAQSPVALTATSNWHDFFQVGGGVFSVLPIVSPIPSLDYRKVAHINLKQVSVGHRWIWWVLLQHCTGLPN